MHRPHELDGCAIRALVAHDFRNRQLTYALFKRGLKTRGECLTWRGVTEKQALCFAIRSALKVSQANASATRLSGQRYQLFLQRWGRVAVFVERYAYWQYFFANRFVRR